MQSRLRTDADRNGKKRRMNEWQRMRKVNTRKRNILFERNAHTPDLAWKSSNRGITLSFFHVRDEKKG
jgi:hypothetical protein